MPARTGMSLSGDFALLDALGECVLGLDERGRCLHATRPLLDLLKLESEAVSQRPVGDILPRQHARELPPWDEVLAKLRSTPGEPLVSEHETLVRGDGSPLSAGLRVHALASPTMPYLVQVRDLTEKSRQSKAFHASVRSFRSLLDGVTDAVIFLGRNGRGLDANQGVQRMYGIAPSKFIGKTLLGLAEDDSLANLPEILERVFTGEPQRIEFASKGRGRRGFPAEMYLYPANYFGQEAVLAMVHDIAERKSYETGLINARIEAEEAMRMKSQFMGNMSHELRTPMNGILGLGELLLETDLDDEQRDYAQTMLDSGRHLLALLNNLLDFSALSSGAGEVSKVEFSLSMLMEQIQARHGRTCRDKGLNLRLEMAEVPELLLGDSQALSKVLNLLLDNAVRFTECGEVILAVRDLGQENDLQCLCFEVVDTGIGIPEAMHQRIFEAFTQVDGGVTRKHGGTGMGLALARALSDTLGGELSVSSAPGRGSTFTLNVSMQPVA